MAWAVLPHAAVTLVTVEPPAGGETDLGVAWRTDLGVRKTCAKLERHCIRQVFVNHYRHGRGAYDPMDLVDQCSYVARAMEVGKTDPATQTCIRRRMLLGVGCERLTLHCVGRVVLRRSCLGCARCVQFVFICRSCLGCVMQTYFNVYILWLFNAR